MSVQFEFWPTLTFAIIVLSWFGFIGVFFSGKQTGVDPHKKREQKSIVGIVFQGLSYAIVWIFHRQPFTNLVASSKPWQILLSFVTMALAIGSIWFFNAAIRALGKQWSLAARVLEGHQLVTEGPYSVVRNPIYTAMFGMLLATAEAVSNWLGLASGIILFAVGTMIRIRSEERILRAAFGAAFEAYAQRVPAIVPYVF